MFPPTADLKPRNTFSQNCKESRELDRAQASSIEVPGIASASLQKRRARRNCNYTIPSSERVIDAMRRCTPNLESSSCKVDVGHIQLIAKMCSGAHLLKTEVILCLMRFDFKQALE